MDEGPPSSYLLLARDTPVFGSDGIVAGRVKEVLCDPTRDIFDGLVLGGSGPERMLAAELVSSIHERGVDMRIPAAAVAQLPPPHPSRQVKYDVTSGERPWVELLHWLYEHLPHLTHSKDTDLDAARERLAHARRR